MKLRDDTERAIYAAAYALRLAKERTHSGRASAIAAASSSPAGREAAEARFDLSCAEWAIGDAESAVELHRHARKARR